MIDLGPFVYTGRAHERDISQELKKTFGGYASKSRILWREATFDVQNKCDGLGKRGDE